jgi:hypothetical protein
MPSTEEFDKRQTLQKNKANIDMIINNNTINTSNINNNILNIKKKSDNSGHYERGRNFLVNNK